MSPERKCRTCAGVLISLATQDDPGAGFMCPEGHRFTVAEANAPVEWRASLIESRTGRAAALPYATRRSVRHTYR